MAAEQAPEKSLDRVTPRRAPVQARSRRRVEAILDGAERLVVERGVESLSTRGISEAAGVPVASLYQYFADKDDVLVALVERHMAEMDEQTTHDLGLLDDLTMAALVRSTMGAFVAVYLRRPAFVELYLRGRTNPVLHAYGREHNLQVARTLRDFARDAGIAGDHLTERSAVLAVEVGDRIFQLAFEHDPGGDADTIEEGIAMVTAYLERYATPAAGASR